MEKQNTKEHLDFVLFKVIGGIVSDALAEPDLMMLSFMVTDENEVDRIVDECRAYVSKIIVGLINDGSAKVLIDNKEKPKGWAFLINMGNGLCIQYLYINEDERGKGLGKAMVETIKNGGKSIGLISSMSARPFWEKMGFEHGSTQTFGFLMAHRVKKEDEVRIFKLTTHDIDNIKKIIISGK